METTPGFEHEFEIVFFSGTFLVIWLAFAALMIVSMWKIFEKAGEEGWKAIIPIYNLIVWMQITKTPLWMLALVLIPILNFIGAFVVTIVLAINTTKVFNKDAVYAVLLIFLPIIGYPLLAFGPDQYIGAKTDVPVGE